MSPLLALLLAASAAAGPALDAEQAAAALAQTRERLAEWERAQGDAVRAGRPQPGGNPLSASEWERVIAAAGVLEARARAALERGPQDADREKVESALEWAGDMRRDLERRRGSLATAPPADPRSRDEFRSLVFSVSNTIGNLEDVLPTVSRLAPAPSPPSAPGPASPTPAAAPGRADARGLAAPDAGRPRGPDGQPQPRPGGPAARAFDGRDLRYGLDAERLKTFGSAAENEFDRRQDDLAAPPPGKDGATGRPDAGVARAPADAAGLAASLPALRDTPRWRLALESAGLPGLRHEDGRFMHRGAEVDASRIEALLAELRRLPENADDPEFASRVGMDGYERLLARHAAAPEDPVFRDVERRDGLRWERSCSAADAGRCNAVAMSQGLFYKSGKPVPAATLAAMLERLESAPASAAHRERLQRLPRLAAAAGRDATEAAAAARARLRAWASSEKELFADTARLKASSALARRGEGLGADLEVALGARPGEAAAALAADGRAELDAWRDAHAERLGLYSTDPAALAAADAKARRADAEASAWLLALDAELALAELAAGPAAREAAMKAAAAALAALPEPRRRALRESLDSIVDRARRDPRAAAEELDALFDGLASGAATGDAAAALRLLSRELRAELAAGRAPGLTGGPLAALDGEKTRGGLRRAVAEAIESLPWPEGVAGDALRDWARAETRADREAWFAREEAGSWERQAQAARPLLERAAASPALAGLLLGGDGATAAARARGLLLALADPGRRPDAVRELHASGGVTALDDARRRARDGIPALAEAPGLETTLDEARLQAHPAYEELLGEPLRAADEAGRRLDALRAASPETAGLAEAFARARAEHAALLRDALAERAVPLARVLPGADLGLAPGTVVQAAREDGVDGVWNRSAQGAVFVDADGNVRVTVEPGPGGPQRRRFDPDGTLVSVEKDGTVSEGVFEEDGSLREGMERRADGSRALVTLHGAERPPRRERRETDAKGRLTRHRDELLVDGRWRLLSEKRVEGGRELVALGARPEWLAAYEFRRHPSLGAPELYRQWFERNAPLLRDPRVEVELDPGSGRVFVRFPGGHYRVLRADRDRGELNDSLYEEFWLEVPVTDQQGMRVPDGRGGVQTTKEIMAFAVYGLITGGPDEGKLGRDYRLRAYDIDRRPYYMRRFEVLEHGVWTPSRGSWGEWKHPADAKREDTTWDRIKRSASGSTPWRVVDTAGRAMYEAGDTLLSTAGGFTVGVMGDLVGLGSEFHGDFLRLNASVELARATLAKDWAAVLAHPDPDENKLGPARLMGCAKALGLALNSAGAEARDAFLDQQREKYLDWLARAEYERLYPKGSVMESRDARVRRDAYHELREGFRLESHALRPMELAGNEDFARFVLFEGAGAAGGLADIRAMGTRGRFAAGVMGFSMDMGKSVAGGAGLGGVTSASTRVLGNVASKLVARTRWGRNLDDAALKLAARAPGGAPAAEHLRRLQQAAARGESLDKAGRAALQRARAELLAQRMGVAYDWVENAQGGAQAAMDAVDGRHADAAVALGQQLGFMRYRRYAEQKLRERAAAAEFDEVLAVRRGVREMAARRAEGASAPPRRAEPAARAEGVSPRRVLEMLMPWNQFDWLLSRLRRSPPPDAGDAAYALYAGKLKGPGVAPEELLRRALADPSKVAGTVTDERVRRQRGEDCAIQSLYHLPGAPHRDVMSYETFLDLAERVVGSPIRRKGMLPHERALLARALGLEVRLSFVPDADTLTALLRKGEPVLGRLEFSPPGWGGIKAGVHAVEIQAAIDGPQGRRFIVRDSNAPDGQYHEYAWDELQALGLRVTEVRPQPGMDAAALRAKAKELLDRASPLPPGAFVSPGGHLLQDELSRVLPGELAEGAAPRPREALDPAVYGKLSVKLQDSALDPARESARLRVMMRLMELYLKDRGLWDPARIARLEWVVNGRMKGGSDARHTPGRIEIAEDTWKSARSTELAADLVHEVMHELTGPSELAPHVVQSDFHLFMKERLAKAGLAPDLAPAGGPLARAARALQQRLTGSGRAALAHRADLDATAAAYQARTLQELIRRRYGADRRDPVGIETAAGAEKLRARYAAEGNARAAAELAMLRDALARYERAAAPERPGSALMYLQDAEKLIRDLERRLGDRDALRAELRQAGLPDNELSLLAHEGRQRQELRRMKELERKLRAKVMAEAEDVKYRWLLEDPSRRVDRAAVDAAMDAAGPGGVRGAPGFGTTRRQAGPDCTLQAAYNAIKPYAYALGMDYYEFFNLARWRAKDAQAGVTTGFSVDALAKLFGDLSGRPASDFSGVRLKDASELDFSNGPVLGHFSTSAGERHMVLIDGLVKGPKGWDAYVRDSNAPEGKLRVAVSELVAMDFKRIPPPPGGRELLDRLRTLQAMHAGDASSFPRVHGDAALEAAARATAAPGGEARPGARLGRPHRDYPPVGEAALDAARRLRDAFAHLGLPADRFRALGAAVYADGRVECGLSGEPASIRRALRERAASLDKAALRDLLGVPEAEQAAFRAAAREGRLPDAELLARLDAGLSEAAGTSVTLALGQVRADPGPRGPCVGTHCAENNAFASRRADPKALGEKPVEFAVIWRGKGANPQPLRVLDGKQVADARLDGFMAPCADCRLNADLKTGVPDYLRDWDRER